MAKDIAQSRKWMVTINNPEEHGYTHEKIISIMSNVRGNSLYWCMCDEEGDEWRQRSPPVERKERQMKRRECGEVARNRANRRADNQD